MEFEDHVKINARALWLISEALGGFPKLLKFFF